MTSTETAPGTAVARTAFNAAADTAPGTSVAATTHDAVTATVSNTTADTAAGKVVASIALDEAAGTAIPGTVVTGIVPRTKVADNSWCNDSYCDRYSSRYNSAGKAKDHIKPLVGRVGQEG